ncbi:hypothetical protein IE53DRAFT_110563 [Violaceomyces palustris]|uniref:Uncharacterized protein n=1 Tax=Violaceomyces palustris TaxID=1673888 RepID=A0ACD0NWG0_9BASI|nr:hypothetical protein IE53DRAFT_110563 [Violaceomyces palustris]
MRTVEWQSGVSERVKESVDECVCASIVCVRVVGCLSGWVRVSKLAPYHPTTTFPTPIRHPKKKKKRERKKEKVTSNIFLLYFHLSFPSLPPAAPPPPPSPSSPSPPRDSGPRRKEKGEGERNKTEPRGWANHTNRSLTQRSQDPSNIVSNLSFPSQPLPATLRILDLPLGSQIWSLTLNLKRLPPPSLLRSPTFCFSTSRVQTDPCLVTVDSTHPPNHISFIRYPRLSFPYPYKYMDSNT